MKHFFIASIKLLTWCTIKILLATQYIVYHLKQKLLYGGSKRHCRASHPYHCVVIDPLDPEDTHLNSDTEKETQLSVCICVRKQLGVRYLSHSAPQLPLLECNCKNCNCRYKHYEDRRNLVRRNSDETHKQLYSHLETNDRESKDRRHGAKV